MKKIDYSKLILATMLFTAVIATTFVGCKSYDDDIKGINSKLGTVEAAVSTMNAQVATLNATVGTLSSQMSQNNTAIATLTSQLGDKADKADLKALQDANADLKKAIDTANEKIAANEKAIADLESAFENAGKIATEEMKAYTDEAVAAAEARFEQAMNEVNLQVKANADAIATISTSIEELKAKNELIESALRQCETTIEGLESAIEESKGEIAELRTLYNTLQGDVNALKTAIQKLQSVIELIRIDPVGHEANKTYIAYAYNANDIVWTGEKGDLKKGVYSSFAPDFLFSVYPTDADVAKYNFSLTNTKGTAAELIFGSATKFTDVATMTKAGNQQNAWKVSAAVAESLKPNEQDNISYFAQFGLNNSKKTLWALTATAANSLVKSTYDYTVTTSFVKTVQLDLIGQGNSGGLGSVGSSYNSLTNAWFVPTSEVFINGKTDDDNLMPNALYDYYLEINYTKSATEGSKVTKSQIDNEFKVRLSNDKKQLIAEDKAYENYVCFTYHWLGINGQKAKKDFWVFFGPSYANGPIDLTDYAWADGLDLNAARVSNGVWAQVNNLGVAAFKSMIAANEELQERFLLPATKQQVSLMKYDEVSKQYVAIGGELLENPTKGHVLVQDIRNAASLRDNVEITFVPSAGDKTQYFRLGKLYRVVVKYVYDPTHSNDGNVLGEYHFDFKFDQIVTPAYITPTTNNFSVLNGREMTMYVRNNDATAWKVADLAKEGFYKAYFNADGVAQAEAAWYEITYKTAGTRSLWSAFGLIANPTTTLESAGANQINATNPANGLSKRNAAGVLIPQDDIVTKYYHFGKIDNYGGHNPINPVDGSEIVGSNKGGYELENGYSIRFSTLVQDAKTVAANDTIEVPVKSSLLGGNSVDYATITETTIAAKTPMGDASVMNKIIKLFQPTINFNVATPGTVIENFSETNGPNGTNAFIVSNANQANGLNRFFVQAKNAQSYLTDEQHSDAARTNLVKSGDMNYYYPAEVPTSYSVGGAVSTVEYALNPNGVKHYQKQGTGGATLYCTDDVLKLYYTIDATTNVAEPIDVVPTSNTQYMLIAPQGKSSISGSQMIVILPTGTTLNTSKYVTITITDMLGANKNVTLKLTKRQ